MNDQERVILVFHFPFGIEVFRFFLRLLEVFSFLTPLIFVLSPMLYSSLTFFLCFCFFSSGFDWSLVF